MVPLFDRVEAKLEAPLFEEVDLVGDEGFGEAGKAFEDIGDLGIAWIESQVLGGADAGVGQQIHERYEVGSRLKFRLDQLSAELAEVCGFVGVIEEPDDFLGESIRIIGCNQKAVLAVNHGFRNAGDRRGHHWKRHSHGFEKNVWQTVPIAIRINACGKDELAGLAIELDQPVMPQLAGKLDPIRKTEIVDLLTKRLLFGAIADNAAAKETPLVAQQRAGIDQRGKTFLWAKPADAQDQRRFFIGRVRPFRRRESGCTEAVIGAPNDRSWPRDLFERVAIIAGAGDGETRRIELPSKIGRLREIDVLGMGRKTEGNA